MDASDKTKASDECIEEREGSGQKRGIVLTLSECAEMRLG